MQEKISHLAQHYYANTIAEFWLKKELITNPEYRIWGKSLLYSVFFNIFYCCSNTVFCLFFPRLPTTAALHSSLLCFHTPLLFIVHVPFIIVPANPSPFPSLSPPLFPQVTVSLFSISMSLVIFCLLVHFVD